jgi:hypothetical protein
MFKTEREERYSGVPGLSPGGTGTWNFIGCLPKTGADTPSSWDEKPGVYSNLSLDAVANFSFHFLRFETLHLLDAIVLYFYAAWVYEVDLDYVSTSVV